VPFCRKFCSPFKIIDDIYDGSEGFKVRNAWMYMIVAFSTFSATYKEKIVILLYYFIKYEHWATINDMII